MNKELLIALIYKDLQELQILTKGFSEMENFSQTLIDLSVDKAKNIVDCLQKLPLNIKEPIDAPQNEFEIEQKSVVEAKKEKIAEEIVEQNMTFEFVEAPPLTTEKPAEEYENLEQQNFDEVFEILDEPNILPEIEEKIEIAIQETPKEEQKVEPIIEAKVEPKEEQKIETIFNQTDKIPVVQMASQGKVPDLKHAFSIADRFRFQRELFDGNGEKFSKSLTNLNEMETFEQAQDYIINTLKFDLQNSVVQAFIEILKRKF